MLSPTICQIFQYSTWVFTFCAIAGNLLSIVPSIVFPVISLIFFGLNAILLLIYFMNRRKEFTREWEVADGNPNHT